LEDLNAGRPGTLKKQPVEDIAPQGPTILIGTFSTRRHVGYGRGTGVHPSNVRKFRSGEPSNVIPNAQFIEKRKIAGGDAFTADFLSRIRVLLH
jgi:hypothetical protein